MPKLPDNDIFDNPFSSTAAAKAPPPATQAKKRAPKPSPRLAVVEPKKTATTVASARANQGVKKTVYVSTEQLKGLHTEVHRLQMQGKNGREANLSKVIANAIDFYLAR